MPTAILTQPGLHVRLTSQRLEVHGPHPETGEETLLRPIPLHDLERIVAGEDVHFTSPALAELLRRGIPIQIFSWEGRFLGGFLPALQPAGRTRLRQYQRTLDPDFTLTVARRIVAAKLYNQRRVLQRLLANRTAAGSDDPALDNVRQTLDQLEQLFPPIRQSRSVDELRGFEGLATARYFQAWATFLPAEFPFERRSTRPPHNPVNACISFAATLLYSEATAFCHAHGLDPALGTLHLPDDGRWSLALDLIEPFRPALVEALALDLFSHKILNHSHFENRDGGCFLNPDGRRKFFLQYERRMEREFLSETVGHRTTLRQQLENQATLFKTALENPDAFEPFLIN
jgi:CRISPR-associated protein Cas1